MTFDRIVKGGNVVTPAGSFIGDIGIAGEKIVALGVELEAVARAPRSSTPPGTTCCPACSTCTCTSSFPSAAPSPPTTTAAAPGPARGAA